MQSHGNHLLIICLQEDDVAEPQRRLRLGWMHEANRLLRHPAPFYCDLISTYKTPCASLLDH